MSKETMMKKAPEDREEEAIHGRIFRTVEELRLAVAAFVERYNAHWRVEKLGFLTPIEARLRHAQAVAA